MRDMVDKLRNFDMHFHSGAWERENSEEYTALFYHEEHEVIEDKKTLHVRGD